MKTDTQPSERDLEIWEKVNEDLLDWLYTGLTGRFQIAGHQVIDLWARPHTDGVVLEIGCGHGHHLRFGRNDYQCYLGLDIEHRFLRTLRKRFHGIRVVNGDAYALPFRDQSVDCVLSVYCFEHLRKLPKCLSEISRVLKPKGELLVGLPAEGGLTYGLGRRFTSKRYMEKKYGVDYDAIVNYEHPNKIWNILKSLKKYFRIVKKRYIPLGIPTHHLNVVVCLRCVK
jgi:SAM-dependent methyltransferase